MRFNPLARRDFLRALAATGACLAAPALAQEPGGLKEPVFRVAKAKNEGPQVAAAQADAHPLDPAIQLAHDALAHLQGTVKDYTARIVSRERVNGTLGPYEYMDAKI